MIGGGTIGGELREGNVTYTISKDHHFSASHVLSGLPDGHPCGRVHGHNYAMRVTLTADRLDDAGFVLDYGDLAPFFAWVDEQFDHRHLNDRMDGNPTAERIARLLADRAAQMLPSWVAVTVAVSETPKTWATWSP